MWMYCCVSCDQVNFYMCVRVSEDSIWTVPSLPVGKGTTWLYVHHSLTSDPLGSCTHKPRDFHIRWPQSAGQLSIVTDALTETERRNQWWLCRRTELFSQAVRVSLEFTQTFLNPCVTQHGKQHTDPPNLSKMWIIDLMSFKERQTIFLGFISSELLGGTLRQTIEHTWKWSPMPQFMLSLFICTTTVQEIWGKHMWQMYMTDVYNIWPKTKNS